MTSVPIPSIPVGPSIGFAEAVWYEVRRQHPSWSYREVTCEAERRMSGASSR